MNCPYCGAKLGIDTSICRSCGMPTNPKDEELELEKLLEKEEEKIDELDKNWKHKHDKLAYYIEHDELEKVETGLTGLKASLAVEDYEAGVVELEKAIYLLEHIKEKQVFSFINIF